MADASRQSSSAFGSPSLARRPSLIDRVDPRSRIVAALAFSAVVGVAVHRFPTLALALFAAALGTTTSGLRPGEVLRRLAPVNLLVLCLFALVPWRMQAAAPDDVPLATLGPLVYTQDGFLLACRIALKANAVVLTLVVLLAHLEMITVGHALSHLRVPEKLTHLLLFTVRYFDVLRRESQRLRAAMKARGFRPRMNRHTYRSYGYLVGMLLVRSLDRSERIMAAMKCRGFRGRFYLLDHFAFSRADAWFAATSLLVLAALVLVEVLVLVE
jgi:cobalt/nickel transport system permease protein